jgi:hypothetical protein
MWMPIAGTLVMLVEVCFLLLGTTQAQSNILLGALGAALAVLGPGNRSIDALRYGRKRFDIRDPWLLATTVGITAINTAARTNILQSFFWAWTSFAIRNNVT